MKMTYVKAFLSSDITRVLNKYDMTKRRQISLLPQVHQSDALRRFFNSTVDQVFEDGKTVPVSGYIGRKPDHFDPEKDFYKPEPTPARERYQLEPMMISADEDRVLQSQLFYEDLLSRLNQEGAITSDPNRLFGAGYYSWAPPIDIDRIMNFQQYYWAGANTTALTLTVPGVEIGNRFYADGATVEFALPPVLPSRTDGEEAITVLLNGITVAESDYTVSSTKVTFADAPPVDATIVIFRYGNITDGDNNTWRIPAHCPASEGLDTVYAFINGRPLDADEYTVDLDAGTVTFNVTPPAHRHIMITRIRDLKPLIEGRPQFDPSGLTLYPVTALLDGLKVKLIDPINFAYGYDLKAYGHPWDELGHNTYFVEGCDISIVLIEIPESEFGGDGYDADDPRYIVIARTDRTRSFWSRVNRWVHRDALINAEDATPENQAKRPIIEFLENIKQFDYGTYRIQNTSGKITSKPLYDGSLIDFTDINGLPEGSVTIDDGFSPSKGDVIFVNLPNASPHNNRLYYVDTVATEDDPLTQVYVLEPQPVLEDGAITSIKQQEYWFNGAQWQTVPTPGDAPLFDLHDNDGISLADVGVYPETNFTGSPLFTFALGTGLTDSILKLKLRHDKYGQIVFENALETRTYRYRDGDIGGYYYYERNDKFLNAWHKADANLVQAIDANNVSDIPLNLQANPDFETPTFLSRNDFFEHFASILERQDGFEGRSYSRNNWYKTKKDVTKGLVIIQHEAPLLKLMALMEAEDLSVPAAIRFIDREYSRIKAKFLKTVLDISLERDVSSMPRDELAVMAMKRVCLGRTNSFPFHDSDVGGGKFFIPLTPALIGITRLVKPEMIIDDTFGQDVTFIRGHDGSATAAFGDARDAALLAFETRIYNSAKGFEEHMRLDDLVESKTRPGLYSHDEFTTIMMPAFERWARDNNVNFENTTFDENDPFTWNYRSATDRYGRDCRGHWRGLYMDYFDTDKPHLEPWAMLGFWFKPDWWESRYGPAPYTRGNVFLWEDIEAGIIREGERAGTYAKYARPDLMQILPVDLNGELLDPMASTLIQTAPPLQFARGGWQFGDLSNIEAIWRYTSSYYFSLALAKFLMRPAYFVERYWDVLNETIVHDDQLVQTPALRRIHHAEIAVHGEVQADTSVWNTIGIQNWVVDHLRQSGRTSTRLGNIVRGLKTQLGHKMAGFTTPDRMTISAESFGLVPDEDITISIYRSPSMTEYFYSGILIENTPTGFRVVGYNPDYPFFDLILGEEHSRKTKISSGRPAAEQVINPWSPNVYYKKDVLVEYKSDVYRSTGAHTSSGKFEKSFWKLNPIAQKQRSTTVYKHTKSSGVLSRIEYGAEVQTKQEVADIIFGYERFLKAQGFVFAAADHEDTSWVNAVRTFLRWSEVNWEDGSFVTLSPSARQLKFVAPRGIVVELSNALLDRTGHFFKKENYSVDRDETETVITAHTDDIYGARLNKTEIEHSIIFSNTTIFGDIIFNPLYNIRQYRLKLSARVASDWTGRYEAPGFVIQQGQIVPNFVKLGEDLRDMFDIELADNTVLRDHARHVIGFETRDYLDRLLLNETQQFEMYQGMIQQKGAKGALSAILRSDEVEQSRNLTFLEEWAFRIGTFGAYHPTFQMEFVLKQDDMHNEKQIVHLHDHGKDDWVKVADSAWVSVKGDFRALLTDKTSETMPDAGYVRTNEVTYIYRDLEDFGIAVQKGLLCEEGETVWTTHGDRWDVGRLTYPTADLSEITILRIDNESTGFMDNVEDIRITFDKAHNLNVGDQLLLVGGHYEFWRGVHTVLRKDAEWVEIDADFEFAVDFEEQHDNGNEMQPPTPLITRTLRKANIAGRDALPFGNGTLAYVDDAGEGKWKVFKKIGGVWIEHRRQPKMVENKAIASGLLFDEKSRLSADFLDVEPAVAERMTVVDPLAGLIPGVADRELDYKLEYDPADYDSWGPDQLGKLWWNLDTVRFLNYYTDACEDFEHDTVRYEDELSYRADNWCKVSSTSTVDVYEWTRSLKVPEDAEYVTYTEYDAGLNRTKQVYYHWALNPITVPRNSYRRLSAKSCSEIIQNPAKAGLIWYAAMSEASLLVAGIQPILDDDGRIMQIDYRITDYEGEEHSEWLLLRPGDKTSIPPAPLWNKLLDSLRDYDVNLANLPSQTLHPTQRSGLGQLQSMFGDVPNDDARQSFIRMLNYILLRKNHSRIGSLEDKLSAADVPSEYYLWTAHSGELALLPPKTTWDYKVMSFDDLDEAISKYYRVLVDNRGADAPSWSIWERGADGKPVLMTAYDRVVNNRADLATAFFEMKFKERVLVLNDEEADGFWTIWEKRGEGAWDVEPFDEFVYDGFDGVTLGLVNAQKYRSRDFWTFADWYDASVDPSVPPHIIYNTLAQRDVTEGLSPENDYVQVLDDDGYWSWTRWDGTQWLTVARENATIQVDETFITRSDVYGIQNEEMFLDVSLIPTRDGTFDLTPLIEALRAHVLTVEEVNELWFSMIHFIHSRLDKVDWAMKTSFMSILGFNERLWASPVAVEENMPLLLEYIEEVKPYRVKVRDILRTAAPDIDVANTIATDFDKPVYFDPVTEQYRRLQYGVDDDILNDGLYRHHTNFPDKRRKVHVGMVFDRIWHEANTTAGAADRIMAYYQPGSNMREKNLTDLLNLDFKGTIYDGSTLGDTDYDILLKGSNAAGSQIDLNVEGGFKLRDPHAAANKPEELVSVGAHDGLVIRVHDKWGNGAPQHTVRFYDVSRRKVASVTLDVGALVDSVAVFLDGQRMDNFTFDQLGHTVTVNIVPGTSKGVAIHGFGFSAVDAIRTQRYYKGGAASFELQDAFTGHIEASINGEFVPQEDVSVELHTVTLPATTASAAVMLTAYTTEDPRPIRQQTETLTGAGPWQLTNLPELRPYHAAMIVEKNGLRMTPPRTYYTLDETSYWLGYSDASDIRVWDDRTLNSYTVVPITDITSDDFEDEVAIRNALTPEVTSERFVLWENRIVFLDEDAGTRPYVVTVMNGHDFYVNEAGLLRVTTPLNENDVIKVTTFSHDLKMDVRTHTYEGNKTGIYSLRTSRNGRAWLTVNGKRLVENIDFTIEERDAGAWDIDPFETFIYDSFRFVQIAIRLPGDEPISDVVITTFEGRENNSDNLWQLSTTTPAEMRMLPAEEGGQTMYLVRKAWEIAGLDPIRRAGSLTAAIDKETPEITLKLNPAEVPSVMIPSQPLHVPDEQNPGVVWIGGERIEYFGYDRSGLNLTLSQLRRGTRGTAKLAHDAGVLALAGHELDRLPPAPPTPPEDIDCFPPDNGPGGDGDIGSSTPPSIGILSSTIASPTFAAAGDVTAPSGVALQNMTMAIQGFNQDNQYEWTNMEMQDSFLYNEHVDAEDNIILIGEHSSNATLNADAMVTKYDGEGVIQWMKTVNAGVGGQSDAFWCATSDSANNVIAFGSLKTSATERKGSMFKFAPDGSLLLQKVFNYPTIATRETIIFKAINDGTHSYVIGYQNGANRNFLMKLDGAGDIVWQKLLNDTTDSFGINDLMFDNSGNVIVLYMIADTAYQGFLKYAPDGTLVWNKAVETSFTAWGWNSQGKVAVDATDNIYACVDDWDTNSTRVIKLDSDGDLQWSKRYYMGDAGGAWYFELTRGSVHATAAGVFFISHMTSYNSSGIIIVQIDPTDGDILNQRMLNVGGADGSYPDPFTSVASGDKFVVAGSYFTTTFPYGVRKDYTGCFVVPQVGEAKFGDFGALSDIVAGTNYEVHALNYADTQVADTSTFGIAPVSGEDIVATTSAYTVVDVAAPVWGAASVTPMETYSDAGDNWALNYGFGAPITRYLGGFAADTDIQGNLVVASYDEGVGSPMVALTKFDPDGGIIWERKMAGPSSANDMHVIRIDKTTNDIFLLSQDTFNDIWTMWRFNSQGVSQYQRRMTGLNANTFVFDDTYIYVTGQTPVAGAVTTLFKLQKSTGALVAQVTLGSTGETPYSINFADDGSLLLTAGHFQAGVTTAGRRLTLWNLSTALTTVNWQRRLYITAGSTNNHSYGGNTFVDGSDIYVIGDQFTNTITPAPPAALTLFAKFDDTGAFQFHRVYGSTDGTITVLPTYGSGNVTAVRLDGDFIVLGNIFESGIYNYDFALMRFDVAGDLVSVKRIGAMGTNGEQSYALTTDGTFLYISARQEGDTFTTLLMKLHKDNIVNGTYGTFTITDLSMNEYTDVVTMASATHDGTAPAVSAYSMTAGTYAVSNTNPGLITAKQTFAGTAAASARPSWLDARATTGINFMTGEAWVNDTLVTDFSTIFDNFDGARMDSSGYDQTDGDGALQAKGALLTALAPLNWAVRAEADVSPTQVNPFPSLMGAVDSTWDNGMELQFNTSFGADEFKATFSDYMGDYAEGAPFRSGVHVFAASNNPTTGWSLAIDGGSALHQDIQSVWTASKISFGSDTDNTGEMFDHFSGYQRIWQFFPLMPDEGLIDLSLNDGTDARPAWLHAEAEFGINFMVGEAYVTGRLYTDLSEVLRGNFDPANLSASGYTQVDATDGMKVDFGLLNRMSRMDWAMCMEWNASGAAQSFNVIEGTGTSTLTGFEMYRSSANGDLVFGDYASTYANAGTLRGYQSLDGKFTPATYKVAMSNNVEGWVASMAGQTATTSTGQTPPGTNHIAIACGLSGNMPADAINGTIKKLEFFPRMQAAQLQTLATIALPAELPGYRGVGTAASAVTPTASLVPTMAAGTVSNDYILLVTECPNAVTVAAPSGYTLIGTGAGTDSKIQVFGRRATGSNPNPTVTRVGDHTTARILVLKNVITTGNPWEALATGSFTGDPLTLPTLTTTVDQSLVLQFVATGVDSTSIQLSAFTNASLRAYSDRMSTYQTTGDGGGFAVGGGWKETAGLVSASTVTHALSTETVGYVSLSIKPA